MEQPGLEARVRNLVHRVTRMEQILPPLATKADLDAAIVTLATKAELQAAIALLATKAELQAAIAPLATKAELQAVKEELQRAMAALPTRVEMHDAIRAEGEQTRRHFDVVADGMRAEIRLLAEGLVAVRQQGDARHTETTSTLSEHDRRLTRLEATRLKRE